MHFVNYTILVTLIRYQTLFMLSGGVLLSVLFTLKTGLSFTVGGGLSLLPGWVFGRLFFKTLGSGQAKTIVKRFYYGEALKLLLTAVLFAGVLQWRNILPIPLWAGFVITQWAYWFVLLKVNR